MTNELNQSDWEALSAWMDAELPADQAERVACVVREQPAWARAAAELRALDELLRRYHAPAPDALAERICAARRPARRAARLRLVARWVAPAAAAVAAVVVAAVYLPALTSRPDATDRAAQSDTPPKPAQRTPAEEAPPAAPSRQRVEQVAMLGMDMFRDYDVVRNYETLAAIERLEGGDGNGT